jgi:transcriptional regulator of acetoin/glycerol metabolism
MKDHTRINRITKELLIQKYVVEKKSIKETAEALQISNSFIYNRLKEFDILRRPIGRPKEKCNKVIKND